MSNPLFDRTRRPGSDALSLFGAEPNPPATDPTTASGSESAEPLAAAANISTLDGAPATSDVISLDRVRELSPLRFVDAVALVQSLCAAVKAKGGSNAGMPDLHGVFLTASGEVVTVSPPSGQPAAPELARLLHSLVPTETIPPVGRLLIDRWASGDSTDLTQFASELSYFARPNGRELLVALHTRANGSGNGNAAIPPLPLPSVVRPEPEPATSPASEVRDDRAHPAGLQSWLRTHKRHLVTAAAVVMTTVVATALISWFLPSRTAEAAPRGAITQNATGTLPAEAAEPEATRASAPVVKASAAATAGRRGVQAARRSAQPRAATTPKVVPGANAPAAPPLAPIPVTTAQLGNAGTVDLPARGLPDTRVYSAADTGVEPPTLKSAEIPEVLISGFPTRANWVEIVIDPRGGVQKVRMMGPPQRIPDIMLLSRVKEWLFEPATKDGLAVSYKLILSWNVTP